jgi:hypothetical protein
MNQPTSPKVTAFNATPKMPWVCRRAALLGLAILSGFTIAAELHAQTNVAADFAFLTSGQAGNTTSKPGSPGNVVAFGRDAFPVLEDPNGNQTAAMAAGRAGTATNSARGVAYSHSGMFNTGNAVKSALFDNAVLWASRKANRASVLVGVGPGFPTNFFTGLGYQVKSVTTTMTTTNNDLTGCDVFVGDWHSIYTSNAITKITNFTATGGGVVCVCTPWALGATDYANANLVLDRFGLVYGAQYVTGNTLAVPTTNWPSSHVALPAADLLLLDKQGVTNLTTAEKRTNCTTIDLVYEVRSDIAELNSIVEQLSQLYGLISPTEADPLNRNQEPVESMLARYQSRQFDVLPPGQLFVHPGTSNYPGLPGAGPLVSKTITVNGNTLTSTYMAYSWQPFRFETGLYAQPGTAFTITIPAALTNAGLQVHIGATEDTLFNINVRRSFPKIWRRSPLTNATTQVGHVFGGLITILVPTNLNLGNFQVTVSNALAAPSFVLGQNTDAEWNATLRTNAGAWGTIVTPKLTIYVPAVQLAEVRNPTEIAQYWQRVMDISDAYYGYTPYRKRSEAIMVNPQLGYAGAGAYAAYPIEMGYGSGRDEVLLNGALRFGDWGAYHELGHGFQENFQSAFIIATHGEVDVNLLPGMMYTMLHDVGPWDASNHQLNGTYEALERLTARSNFFALAPASQTWDTACNSAMGYDFYFNLSEAFGWQVYSNALGRLMRWLQGTPDAELTALNSADPNYKRNRFYLLFCDAAQRNLDTYFQRYGLGVTGLGYEITAAVKAQVANKGYAVWSDNTPLSNLSSPGTLNITENLAPGTALYAFAVTEPDPGEILTWQITSGNNDGAFSIDRHAGVLRVGAAGLDYERATSYSLTVQVQGHGIPLSGVRPTASQSFTVNVLNLPDGPSVALKMFTATNSMPPGIVVGTCTALVESGRALSKWEIVFGNSAGLFAINNAGQLSLSLPGSLPNPGVAELTVRATDSAGGEGYGPVKVLCNATNGLFEQRWAGQFAFTGAPNYTGRLTNFSTAQNVADTFSRRVSGWLIPPVSGDYTFWVAADDIATFYFSTDSTEALKRPFAEAWAYTGYASWDEQRSQKSQTFTLQAGKAYYIEGTQIEGTGGDFLNIAWSGPGIARQTIPGSALVPALGGMALGPQSPFAAWQTLKFGAGATNTVLAGPNADPDGDGLSNVEEYALGLDPLASNGMPWQFGFTNIAAQSYLSVTVSRDPAANDVVIDPQITDPLIPAAWSGSNTLTLVNTPATFSVRDIVPVSAATNRFLRLRFTLP